jgi:endonuclease/exonuclease/phosphatase (EEP) superfamily protein YafD
VDLPLAADVAEWLAPAAIAVVAVSALRRMRGNAALAIAQDLQPYLLATAWPVLGLAIVGQSWWLAAAAAVVAVRHAALVLPRLRSSRMPAWVHDAPVVRLAVSNVFVDNETPARLAAELVASDADVIVVAEWNPTFAAAFRSTPGAGAYVHRVEDPADRSDYAVCVLSRLPLDPGSGMVTLGALRAAHAVVRTATGPLHVFGLNPMAAVDPGGYDAWRAQMGELVDLVPTIPHPFVLAGDLNTTQFRPEFRTLLRAGTTDAHDSLGRGLTRSFRLAAHGLLARLGDVVRLDHALLSPDVRAVAARDLSPCGSDHRPFVVSLVLDAAAGSVELTELTDEAAVHGSAGCPAGASH